MPGFFIMNGAAYPAALIRTASGYAVPGAFEEAGQIAAADGNSVWVHLDGQAHQLLWQDAITYHAEERASAEGDCARAPMPGSVIELLVAAGDRVAAGQKMMIVESMKLEMAIRSTRNGLVETVHVTVGQSIERDAPLISLLAEDR